LDQKCVPNFRRRGKKNRAGERGEGIYLQDASFICICLFAHTNIFDENGQSSLGNMVIW
jgi:hypothetical protein